MPQFSTAQPLNDQQFVAAHPGENAQPVPLWTGIGDAWSLVSDTQRTGSHAEALSKALVDRGQDIAGATGVKLPLTPQMAQLAPNDLDVGGMKLSLDGPFYWFKAADQSIMKSTGMMVDDAEYERRVEKLRAEHPDAMRGIPTRAELLQDIADEATWKQQKVANDRAGGGWGAFGTYIGGIAAGFTDPVNLGLMAATDGGSMFFNGTRLAADSAAAASRPLAARVLASSARGALVNGVFQAAQAPFQMADSQVAGQPYTFGDALGDEGNAILAGAALGPIFEGISHGLGWAKGKLGREVLREGGLDPVDRGALEVNDQVARDEMALRNLAPGEFETAQTALATGDLKPPARFDQDLTTLFDEPLSTSVAHPQPGFGDLVLAQQEYRGRMISAASFDPATLQADPVRFQYKAGADAQGVTERLRGVQQWDPTASGKVVVWEDPNGQKFVADGHQRLALAQRLATEGFTDARLDGYLLRAADGWTSGDARIIAALKNIREGSGTALDAAKVFRDAPQAINDRSLPMTGEFMSQARGLARLSDDAFGAVINKVLPERYGAILGDMAGDRPDLQPSLVKLLVKGEPANMDEARALVSEGLLDDFVQAEGIQSDLFGGQAPDLTTIARGKVKASVTRSLKSNAELMASLVRKADAIEAGGNVLARDANEAQMAVDRAALELVDKLSLRDGPIGKAMAEAAREVNGGKRPADAAKKVAEMIRQAIRDGHIQDLIRGDDIAPKAPDATAIADLKVFDDPNGKGAQDQAQGKPEDRALELGQPADGEPALHPGLFDDLPEVGAEERARTRLAQCAPE